MLIVDRIEEGFAVLEQPDRTTVTLPLSELPAGLREGDCLHRQGGGYIIDGAETDRRRAQNAELFKKLLGGGKEG